MRCMLWPFLALSNVPLFTLTIHVVHVIYVDNVDNADNALMLYSKSVACSNYVIRSI